MQVLIIEDEPRAANQLQNLLNDCNFEFELLEVIDTVEEAIVWFKNKSVPDLIFMDIQLADGLCFEIFQKVEIEAPIIFTTAFDQYAIQAFKVNSVDYLLKPIQKEELNLALDQFQKSLSKSASFDPAVIKELMARMQQPKQRTGILVKEGSGFVQIAISDLLYIYSEDSLTFGVTAEKRVVIDETMDQIFNSLDPSKFFRINRGQTISKSAIKKIEPYFNHRVKLIIANPRNQEFIVSRPKTSDFKTWMNS